MKIRLREKIKSIHVEPEDTIQLSHKVTTMYPTGIERTKETVVLKDTIGKAMTLNEAVIFEVEEGDDFKAKGGIGGAFLYQED